MRTVAIIFFAGLVWGQSAFEVADIHPSAPATNPDTFASGGLSASGSYDLRRATMLDLIKIAWGVEPEKILGGPNWLAFNRFDIAAKVAPSTPPATINLMLQALLVDRFKLVVNKDTKPLPALVLAMGKGQARLKKSDESGDSGCEEKPQSDGFSGVACRNMTMAEFAASLQRLSNGVLSEAVVNATNLEGSWDFSLRWSSRSAVLPGTKPARSLKRSISKWDEAGVAALASSICCV